MFLGNENGLDTLLVGISVSRLARESNSSESEIKAGLKHDGYLLMTPEQFAELLDKVEQAVLNGSSSLPINIDKLNKQIPEGC